MEENKKSRSNSSSCWSGSVTGHQMSRGFGPVFRVVCHPSVPSCHGGNRVYKQSGEFILAKELQMGDDSFISDKVRVAGTIKWPPSGVKKFLPVIVWMFWQLLSFLPASTHAALKGVKTYQVLFDTKLLAIMAHEEPAVFLTLTWLLCSHTSCQLRSK